MGSFNIRCDITNSAITDGDEVVELYFTESLSGWLKPEPLFFRIAGTYDDYGRLLPHCDDPTNVLVFGYLETKCADFFNAITFNKGWTYDTFFELVFKQCLQFHGVTFPDPACAAQIDFTENKYHPSSKANDVNSTVIRRVVMHRYAYDYIVGLETLIHDDGYSEVPTKAEVLEKFSKKIVPPFDYSGLEERMRNSSDDDELRQIVKEMIDHQDKMLSVHNDDGDRAGRIASSLYTQSWEDCFGNKLSRDFQKYINDCENETPTFDMRWEHYNFVYGIRTLNIELNATKTYAYEQWCSDFTLERRVGFLQAQLEFEQARLKQYQDEYSE